MLESEAVCVSRWTKSCLLYIESLRQLLASVASKILQMEIQDTKYTDVMCSNGIHEAGKLLHLHFLTSFYKMCTNRRNQNLNYWWLTPKINSIIMWFQSISAFRGQQYNHRYPFHYSDTVANATWQKRVYQTLMYLCQGLKDLHKHDPILILCTEYKHQ